MSGVPATVRLSTDGRHEVELDNNGVRAMGSAIRPGVHRDSAFHALVAGLASFLTTGADPAAVFSWETAGEARVLALVDGGLCFVTTGEDGTSAAMRPLGSISSVEAIRLGQIDTYAGMEWNVLEWRITCSDGWSVDLAATSGEDAGRLEEFINALPRPFGAT